MSTSQEYETKTNDIKDEWMINIQHDAETAEDGFEILSERKVWTNEN